jgi:hypothetical protein
MFVLGDGNRLFSSSNDTILQLTPSDRISTIAWDPRTKKYPSRTIKTSSLASTAHVV